MLIDLSMRGSPQVLRPGAEPDWYVSNRERLGRPRGGRATEISQVLGKRHQKYGGAQAQHDERADARIDQRRSGQRRHGPCPRPAFRRAQNGARRRQDRSTQYGHVFLPL